MEGNHRDLHEQDIQPPAQDAAALELLKQSTRSTSVNGNITAAIEAACETWASFPGNSYSQGGRTFAWLLDSTHMHSDAQ